MQYKVGETIRAMRGDMRGRLGVIRRIRATKLRHGQSYDVAFHGETSLSTFRGNNIERAPHGVAVPEFLSLGSTVYRLTGTEPYQVLSGGWMGKRRRYWLAGNPPLPQFAMTDGAGGSCDVRRFPLERNGVVFAGLWSEYGPVESTIQQVVHLLDTTGRKSHS